VVALTDAAVLGKSQCSHHAGQLDDPPQLHLCPSDLESCGAAQRGHQRGGLVLQRLSGGRMKPTCSDREV
jgi:hypothetical protein